MLEALLHDRHAQLSLLLCSVQITTFSQPLLIDQPQTKSLADEPFRCSAKNEQEIKDFKLGYKIGQEIGGFAGF